MLSLTPEVMAEINTGHAPFEITLQAFSADGYEWWRNLVLDYYQLVDMSTQPIIPTESLEWFEVQGDEWGRNLLRNSGNFSNTEGWSRDPAIVVKNGV